MKLAICLLLATTSFAQAEEYRVFRGGTVEDGGNAVFCSSEAGLDDNDLPGINPPSVLGKYYALDYARSIRRGRRPEEFRRSADWAEARDRLARILRDLSPRLDASFREFSESVEQLRLPGNRAAAHLRRRWVKERSFQIVQYVENYASERCLARIDEMPGVDIKGAIISVRGYLRTVTRRQRGKRVKYVYNAPLLDRLEENSALQYSMLLTHEWLWDHTRSLVVNQRVNEFLHLKETETLAPEEILRRLKLLGLRL